MDGTIWKLTFNLTVFFSRHSLLSPLFSFQDST